MTMVQLKSGFELYFLSYEHFYLPNLQSNLGLKKCFLPTQLERRCGSTATATSLKVTWSEGPDQALQENRLASETMLRTQRSCPFSKHENLLLFGISAKEGPI